MPHPIPSRVRAQALPSQSEHGSRSRCPRACGGDGPDVRHAERARESFHRTRYTLDTLTDRCDVTDHTFTSFTLSASWSSMTPHRSATTATQIFVEVLPTPHARRSSSHRYKRFYVIPFMERREPAGLKEAISAVSPCGHNATFGTIIFDPRPTAHQRGVRRARPKRRCSAPPYLLQMWGRKRGRARVHME